MPPRSQNAGSQTFNYNTPSNKLENSSLDKQIDCKERNLYRLTARDSFKDMAVPPSNQPTEKSVS